jgi:DNA polymerase-1
MTTTLLIDGDILVYRAALTSAKTIDWGQGIFTQTADMKQAAQRMDYDVKQWMLQHKAVDAIVALSDPVRDNNWRRRVLPSYKNNRSESGKPIIFHQCREHLQHAYRVEQYKGLEGDDVLGLFATGGSKGDRRIIVSIDKDMANVPGEWFNPNHPERGVVKTSKEQAAFNHLVQTLTGDAVDGYKGCPGVGRVRAVRALVASPRWRTVVRLYEKAGLTEGDALAQARVAHILLAGDYNRKTGDVTLWEPLKEVKGAGRRMGRPRASRRRTTRSR